MSSAKLCQNPHRTFMQKSVRLKIKKNITQTYGASIFCFAVLKSPEILSQSESLEVQLSFSTRILRQSLKIFLFHVHWPTEK